MNLKGLVIVIVIGLAIYSYMQVKRHSPLSSDRVERENEEKAVQGRYD